MKTQDQDWLLDCSFDHADRYDCQSKSVCTRVLGAVWEAWCRVSSDNVTYAAICVAAVLIMLMVVEWIMG